jgi:hypothetical protein
LDVLHDSCSCSFCLSPLPSRMYPTCHLAFVARSGIVFLLGLVTLIFPTAADMAPTIAVKLSSEGVIVSGKSGCSLELTRSIKDRDVATSLNEAWLLQHGDHWRLAGTNVVPEAAGVAGFEYILEGSIKIQEDTLEQVILEVFEHTVHSVDG